MTVATIETGATPGRWQFGQVPVWRGVPHGQTRSVSLWNGRVHLHALVKRMIALI